MTDHPDMPPHAKRYYCNEKGQPCRPEDAYMWCWAGAPKWLYVERPAPEDLPEPDRPRQQTFDTEGQ